MVQKQLLNHKAPRERCEHSLYEFVQQAWHIVEPDKPFVPGWHIEAICRHLEALYEQRIRDLLVDLPPGHCKSRLCNVFFPPWVWTKNPSARFLHASYAQELATRDSVECRYIISSPWYQERWGRKVKLTDDQNQKIKFSTSAHGWRMATSIDKVTGTKEVRAQPLADQCEGGNVFLVQGDWNTRFIEELCIFPAGDHDDQVDAAAGAFMHSIRTPPYEAPSSIGLPHNPRRFGVQLAPNAGGGFRHGIQLDQRSVFWPR